MRDPKLIALMVTRNEENRYIGPVLKQLASQVDAIYVYDDRSDDRTANVAADFAEVVCVRGVNDAAFLEDESAFRSDSYKFLAEHSNVGPFDWVLSIDADELLVNDDGTERESLLEIAHQYDRSSNYCAAQIHKAEVFEVVGNTPYIRVDGTWRNLYTPRFFRWHGYGAVPDGIMGCGSIPQYAMKPSVREPGVSLLHYGYARQEDRVTKYARYFGVRGHNPQHIDSILRSPTLVRWDGPVLRFEDED